MTFRKLNKQEIDTLKDQGCFCENWENLSVKDGFSTDKIRNVTFAGNVQLGIFDDSIEIETGIIKSCGLYDSYIQNCEIDDNVYISNAKNLINYQIASDVAIEDVSYFAVTGTTTFGNGVEIEILNEGGGRELPIFDLLSAQIAYLNVLYRHDKGFIEKLSEIIKIYTATKKSSQGNIGHGSRILSCQKIQNVAIGKNAKITGALHLEEGTIASHVDDPVLVGEGVIAKSFIIQSGSQVDGAAILDHSFVGQGVKIGKQFSAENSAFFANSEGFHGEACSVFAGPYTVTHHKSTLLIAGLFSFYNAGSGSNQSNHMYKIGPVHQGILERGAKTGSFSYLLWPSRIGAFSAVIGKHYTNFDTSSLPFSYILEANDKSLLMPAMNLFTVGTKRDSEKWPKRDRRKDSEKHDLLNFELFNPYSIGKIKSGIEILKRLETNNNDGFVEYNGVVIKQSKIKKAIDNYQTAINIFIGNEIMKKLENLSDFTTFSEIQKFFTPQNKVGNGLWVDMCGMFAPQNLIDNLMNSINEEKIITIDSIKKELKSIHDKYDSASWCWSVTLIEVVLGKKINLLSVDDLARLINNWKNSYLKYNEFVLRDAEKEFSSKSRIGYGIDSNELTKSEDFEAVRGLFEENKFVEQIKKESKEITVKAEKFIRLLEAISKN